MTDLLTPAGAPASRLNRRARRTPARSGALMALVAMTSVQLGLAVSVGLVDVIGVTGAAWLRLSVAALVLLAVVRPRPAHFPRASLRTTLALGVATGGITLLFMAADRAAAPGDGQRAGVPRAARRRLGRGRGASRFSRCWPWSGCCC